MTPIELLTSRYSYIVFVALVGIGLYGVINSSNLVKKVIGLNIFQVGIFLFFIASGYVNDAAPPLIEKGTGTETAYASPLPHVLILTAIVVGVSLTAVALALIIRVYNAYGSLDEDVIREVQLND
ncbi:MAG: multisubunit Na+/H+ antiporter, MnhC subunit [Haloquadratum walsbyi J07HQW1]|jgi:Multisubunit Na+/H+ antiporter, MnhC subunit|uniref:Multisubunit Na+/H+ antiporter, MnhC subunit n=1 Tax=Haloquadratum walsbyi J07HQW1 TaxID=1238424 RepID=U1PFU2_9EURY|nr:MAG: multisubunit Na+/H+ antiporter, MnhC subunit [Haloquadratum walsbyi J07HQW1]